MERMCVNKKEIVTLSMEEAKKRAAETEAEVVESSYVYRGARWPYVYRVTVGAVGKATKASNPKMNKDGTISKDNFAFMVELFARVLVDAPFEISKDYIENKLDPEIFEQMVDEVMEHANLGDDEKKS